MKRFKTYCAQDIGNWLEAISSKSDSDSLSNSSNYGTSLHKNSNHANCHEWFWSYRGLSISVLTQKPTFLLMLGNKNLPMMKATSTLLLQHSWSHQAKLYQCLALRYLCPLYQTYASAVDQLPIQLAPHTRLQRRSHCKTKLAEN
jgi:hypothetical protein